MADLQLKCEEAVRIQNVYAEQIHDLQLEINGMKAGLVQDDPPMQEVVLGKEMVDVDIHRLLKQVDELEKSNMLFESIVERKSGTINNLLEEVKSRDYVITQLECKFNNLEVIHNRTLEEMDAMNAMQALLMQLMQTDKW